MVLTDKRKTCRESMEIMADIIHTCIERRRKTQLMLKARLNHEQISHYTNLLSLRGLLKQYVQNGIVYYIATE
jgi:predicted transcriptional regulator